MVKVRCMVCPAGAINPDVLQRQLDHLQLDSSSRDMEPSSAKVPEVQMQNIRKGREVKYHEALCEIRSRQYETARLYESKDAPVIQVLDEPSYPDVKSGPDRVLLIVGAFYLAWSWDLPGCGYKLLCRASGARSRLYQR